ncbi:MAG: energy-coupling factor transport system permease protein [Thermoleophilaceae bacterium]|nr:energy-coupling factor transport system permease protein [Thermoleophilaceae bacterium]
MGESRGLVPVYTRRASALHATRAGVGAAYCAAFGLAGMLYENPLVLAGALAGVIAAGVAAGVGRQLVRAAWIAVPLALLWVVVNAFVYQEGATVIFRGGELFGRRIDVTLESVAYGADAGLRLLVVTLAFALYAAAVDPDEMLRLLRRFSYRSALTASLATRLVPVLARDASRMGDAARCRPAPPGRAQVARATLTGALDRAVEVAAALEVRGYSVARPPARVHRTWSRHDLRVGTAALLIAAAAIGAKAAGVGDLVPYPTFEPALGPGEMLLAAGLALAGAVPFTGAGARMGVARA